MIVPHIIPVGGSEPVHSCHLSCWCFPLPDDGIVTHNAKDNREARERHARILPGEKWVIINEERP